jgi:hypothetical protein
LLALLAGIEWQELQRALVSAGNSNAYISVNVAGGASPASLPAGVPPHPDNPERASVANNKNEFVVIGASTT